MYIIDNKPMLELQKFKTVVLRSADIELQTKKLTFNAIVENTK